MSISAILLYIILGLLTYFAYIIYKRLHYWQSRGIPCERPNFILGSLKGLMRERAFVDIFFEYYKQFKGRGPYVGFYWFQRPTVFLLDVNVIKSVLIRDFGNFTDRGFFSNEKDDPLTGTLFTLDGHRWRTMRNKMSPAFTSGKMKFMFPTVVKLARDVVAVLEELLDVDGLVEVKDLMTRYTLDVIGTCAFGIEYNNLKHPESEFRAMCRKASAEFRHSSVVMALINSFPELARKMHMKVTADHVERFFLGLVRETVKVREENNIRRNDFMDIMIDMKKGQTIKTDQGEEVITLTVEEIAAQAFLFLMAGFETSSTTMAFALYELAQHEDMQQKARDEINTVLSRHNGEFTYECMKELQYLEQIMSETLRLYTVAPMLSRKTLEDYDVPGYPGSVIEKGMNIFIPIAAIHRDADYYPNPDDFNPDNFSPDKVQQRNSAEYLPFGEGPRNCLGNRFGLMQMRIGLALILQKFKFTVCEKTRIPMVYDIKNFFDMMLLVCNRQFCFEINCCTQIVRLF